MSPPPDTLVGLFAGAAAARPDAVAAAQCDGRSVTYARMDELTGRVANALCAAGVVPGDRVGVCMPKSINSFVSLLGAMRAGAAYVPVDYSAPSERNRFIFRNCEARAICTDEPRAASLGADVAPLLVFPGEASQGVGAAWTSNHAPLPTAPEPGADDLAYILYTSGSTGQPKGVVHTHRSALSFVNWAAGLLRPTAADRFGSHAPFHFDLSILDLYTPMCAGAAVVIIDEALGKDPAALAAAIADQKLTAWYSVPSILAMLAQYGRLEQFDYSSLRAVCFAGEVFPIKHLRRLKSLWPAPVYYNLYGPTETNVCTYYRVPDSIPEDRTTPFPIGRVCENCEALVLDSDGRPVSDGEGVLYIRAAGPVMRDYWNLPEQTQRGFHEEADGTRWYCTGDVVVRDTAGDLVFVGRRDRMVKRRGYRIELGEIEAGLYRHPAVREAAAVARESPEGVTIDAFLSAKSGEKLGVLNLKQYCAQQLPAYMNPDRFVILPELPRTSTGKVDYQGLLKSGAGG